MTTRNLKYFLFICFSISLTRFAHADYLPNLIVCEHTQEQESAQSAVERLNERLEYKVGTIKVVTQGEKQILIGGYWKEGYGFGTSTFSAPAFIADADGFLVCLTIHSSITEYEYNMFLEEEEKAEKAQIKKQLKLQSQQRNFQNSKSSKPNFFKKFFSEPSSSLYSEPSTSSMAPSIEFQPLNPKIE